MHTIEYVTYGDTIEAEVIETHDSNIRKNSVTGILGEHGNYCVIGTYRNEETPDGWSPTYTFYYGRVGAPPIEDRVKGTKGYLKWSRVGNYDGPIWIKEK